MGGVDHRRGADGCTQKPSPKLTSCTPEPSFSLRAGWRMCSRRGGVSRRGGGWPEEDHRRLTRLYCMNGGHHLQILSDGTVQGQRDGRDAHSKAASRSAVMRSRACTRIKSVDRGVVVIRGMEAERYLAMSDDGRLYGSPSATDECYFLEKLEENHYNTYQPQKYLDNNWFVGLKKNGRPKAGPRTHIGQKAVFFLPRKCDGSSE
ncbi:unnamed protein product [Menidia menidia]|uniref:Fibroblast growth factor n=1 Tax=Menidia menidia TaxID=238744 RepID=A0A8S4BJ03_9TELE|nr:unnamed protein product [Menidia menidia]